MSTTYIPTVANTIPKIIEACKARLADALTIPSNVNTSTTETVISKASLHFENKEINIAVNTLCAHLESTNKWSPVLDVAVLLLIDIAIFSDRIAKLQKVMLTYQKVSSHEKSCRFDLLTHHVLTRLEDLMAKNDLASNAVSADAAFLASVLPESSSSVKVGIASATPAVASFVSLYFRKYRYTFGTNFQAAYLSTMTKMLDFIVRHKLSSLLMGLSNSLRDFAKDLFSRTDISSTNTLESAVKNSSGAVIALRFSILESAIKLSQWQVVKFSLEEIAVVYRLIEDAVKRVNRHNATHSNGQILVARHVNDIDIAFRRFAVIADVFLKCENWVFHADALRSQFVFAGAEARPALATKAIVAALCTATESDDAEAKAANAFFEEQTPAMRLVSTLGLTRIPTRETAIAETSENLEIADANAQVLFKMVTEKKKVDITVIYKHLEALKASPVFANTEAADTDRYLAALEHALLAYYMESHFQNTAALEFATFDKVKLLYPKKNDLITIATTLSARVDMKARVASFNTAELKIRNCISAIGTKTSKMLSMPIVKRKLPIVVDATALERENTRLNNRVSLSAMCVHKAAERANNLVKKEIEEARLLREEIEREERERHEALKAANFEKQRKKVEHAENVERRKKVCEMVVKRHHGLHFPAKITEDGKNFLERASAVLAQYRREVEEKRTINLREAHYLEKYIRDTERPRREELERNMADQYKKDSEARIQNFKEQHRRNFENQLALKARLDAYRDRAAAYEEAAIADALAKTKVSKRDEQEDLLRAEKERLAREAAQ